MPGIRALLLLNGLAVSIRAHHRRDISVCLIIFISYLGHLKVQTHRAKFSKLKVPIAHAKGTPNFLEYENWPDFIIAITLIFGTVE